MMNRYIEKEEELIYPDAEQFGPQKVPKLVKENEHRERQDYLEGFHKNHHRADISCCAKEVASLCVSKMASSDGSSTKAVRSITVDITLGMS